MVSFGNLPNSGELGSRIFYSGCKGTRKRATYAIDGATSFWRTALIFAICGNIVFSKSRSRGSLVSCPNSLLKPKSVKESKYLAFMLQGNYCPY